MVKCSDLYHGGFLTGIEVLEGMSWPTGLAGSSSTEFLIEDY
jgi:hypothetical protein